MFAVLASTRRLRSIATARRCAARVAADRWTAAASTCRRSIFAAWRDFPLRARLEQLHGPADVRRQRCQGTRARRRLDRCRGRVPRLHRHGRVDGCRWRHRARRPASRRRRRQCRPHRSRHRRTRRPPVRLRRAWLPRSGSVGDARSRGSPVAPPKDAPPERRRTDGHAGRTGGRVGREPARPAARSRRRFGRARLRRTVLRRRATRDSTRACRLDFSKGTRIVPAKLGHDAPLDRRREWIVGRSARPRLAAAGNQLRIRRCRRR